MHNVSGPGNDIEETEWTRLDGLKMKIEQRSTEFSTGFIDDWPEIEIEPPANRMHRHEATLSVWKETES